MIPLDIHSHGPRRHACICNVRVGSDAYPDAGPFSIGVHPWDAANPSLVLPDKGHWPARAVAIGECGLDRSCDAPFQKQVEVFEKQIRLSEELCLPVIVHCVRAFHEVLLVRRQMRAVQPWIVHGFNKGGDALQNVLEAGLYVSFGAAVLDFSTPAAWACRLTPANRLLVETDDVNMDIADVVAAVAQLRAEPDDVVAAFVNENAKTVRLFPSHSIQHR
jgi:TatD DNase family protein